MINTSISFRIEDKESLERLKNFRSFNIPIQLSIDQSKTCFELKESVVSIIKERNIQVRVVHLPIDCLSLKFDVIIELMDFFFYNIDNQKFVIHPNRGITKFANYFVVLKKDYKLCIENFMWKRKKELRSPLQIYNICQQSLNLKMTFDTSHAETIWFEHKIFSYFLPKISVVHLSNRVNKKGHRPFSVEGGELNLVSFVGKLRKSYMWSGDIVLEYMSEYAEKLPKNWIHLNKLLGI